MSINRYNYEEFFLLYADGELSSLETEMVKQFVQHHPDLKEELDILMDCKLVADIPVFFPKEKLYKQTIWDADNITEMQTNLLLLVDGELEEGFKKKLEKNIEENPALQQEWNTLQQAKIPVETIAHPHKEPLYKEKKVPKIGWLRWAAIAAAIVGAGWFIIGQNINGNHAAELVSAIKTETSKKQPNAAVPDQPKTADAVENTAENNEETSAAQNSATQQNREDDPATTQTTAQLSQNIIPKPTVSKESPDESSSADVQQDLALNNNPATIETDDRSTLTNKAIDNVDDITKVKPSGTKLNAPKIGQFPTIKSTKQLANTTDLQQEADDDEYVRIAGAKVKKQKIRGVFRNVFRGIGRTFSNSKVEAAPTMALNNE